MMTELLGGELLNLLNHALAAGGKAELRHGAAVVP